MAPSAAPGNLPSFQNAADELEYYKNYAKRVEEDLADTRYQLEEFQQSSKELEDELEKEVESTERRYNEIRIRNDAMRQEVEEWKEKYHQTVKDSNANINQLTRQLDVLKQQTEMFIKKERALEQDNDDLERTERATKWSLQELEIKYNAAVEKTAILESEVTAKAALTEEVQRLKDELRDANVELAVMKSNQASMNNGSSAVLSSQQGSDTSLPNVTPYRSPIGSNYEAMPSLRARLAKNSALQRSSARLAGSGSVPPAAGTVSGAPNNPVKAVQDMVGRVKSLEARLASCRSLVTPLLQPPPSYSTSIPNTSGRASLQGSSISSTLSSSSRPGSPTAYSPASSTLTSPKVSRRTSLLLQQHLQQHREQREQQLREQQRAMAGAGLVST
ncbi:NADH:ubiquinone oxidoreductase [Mortierella sp. AD011]|nr:NADH:ubiquinone oxidoreductase [Mortierella sp. AD010]KAF9374715.1 NADH:ubiquinone oxidoreductase [Mortierella sp. AD011]